MKMPVHIFIAQCNILASQFKKEAEEQQKQQDEQMSGMPNLRQFSDIGNLTNGLDLGSLTSSLPNLN